MPPPVRRQPARRAAALLALALGPSSAAQEQAPPPAPRPDAPKELDRHALAQRVHARVHDEPVQQEELNGFLELGLPDEGFRWAFLQGEELFETEFTLLDGGGANVGNGARYTRVPRADLAGPGEWATHVPPRASGPNAASCTACHDRPANDGGGGVEANVHRDPLRSGKLADMLQRNTPHLFGAGAVQRLAEEMTVELAALRDAAAARVLASGASERVALRAKGVDFGALALSRGADGALVTDSSAVSGVGADLVVRPFGWKGDTAGLREFVRDALHEELGLQAVELVGAIDGDHDGVAGEITVGDVTALALYVAAQPRPTTRAELAELGILVPLSEKETEQVARGEELFRSVGCASCHVPELVLEDPRFVEPSAHPAFRDARFPAGQDPLALGVDPAAALSFALDEDLMDNAAGVEGAPRSFGNLEEHARGATVRLYGDLKRHDLGPGLAEPIEDGGVARSVYLTENLWGVGSTAPYLHDGRASTLAEAIDWHGGEAAAARAAFLALPAARQVELIAFLDSLVLLKLEPPPPIGPRPPG